MANLKELRNRITGVKNTSKITSAMKMVSAAKLRRSQDAIESARPYVNKLNEVMSNLVDATSESYENPFSESRANIENIAVVVIGSDRGLCGAFNNNLFKEAWSFINNDLKASNPNANVSLIPVGKKAISFFKKYDLNKISSFPDIFGKLQFSIAKDIVSDIKLKFISGEIDKVVVFVNEFVNIVRQNPSRHQLLPVEAISSENTKDSKFNSNYIYEPGQAEILDDLIPKLIDISMWRFLLESNAAEQAARMMAMDNATRNANELVDSLNLEYNRKRQAAITTEMLEIVSGAEALSN